MQGTRTASTDYRVRVSRPHNESLRLPIVVPQHKGDLQQSPGVLMGLACRDGDKVVVKSTGGLVGLSDADMDRCACVVENEDGCHVWIGRARLGSLAGAREHGVGHTFWVLWPRGCSDERSGALETCADSRWVW